MKIPLIFTRKAIRNLKSNAPEKAWSESECTVIEIGLR